MDCTQKVASTQAAAARPTISIIFSYAAVLQVQSVAMVPAPDICLWTQEQAGSFTPEQTSPILGMRTRSFYRTSSDAEPSGAEISHQRLHESREMHWYPRASSGKVRINRSRESLRCRQCAIDDTIRHA